MAASSDTAPTTRKVGIGLGIGIFLAPYIFAWFTLRSGYSAIARAVSFIWLAVIVVYSLERAGGLPPPTPEAFTESHEIAPTIFAVLIPAASAPDQVEVSARKLCEGATRCTVLGFTEKSLMPTAMPMTEREAAGQIYGYSLNRETGMDESLWDCSSFVGVDPSRCMGKP